MSYQIINPDTKIIFSSLNNRARFVGGCVRNIILGVDVTDIDIATEYKPEDVMAKLQAASIKVIPTGIKHGTVTAILNDVHYEITTLRKDVECDGRHAQVEFTDDWEEDAARRDFTINAMSMDLSGKFYDYFGGQEDIKNGLIRFVGDAKKRVSEDILRILRFFRFNAYYGNGKLDVASLAACKEYAGEIATLSGERVQVEMYKLLNAEKPCLVLEAMQECNIDKYIFLKQVDFNSLKNAQDDVKNCLLRLAILINKFSQDRVTLLANKWKLSNKHKNYLLSVLFPIMEIDFNQGEKYQKKAIRKIGKDLFLDIVILSCAVGACSVEDKNELINIANEWDVPVFPISGKELSGIGFKQGKEMGEALKKAEQWWEENDYLPTKKEILDYIS